MILRRHVPELPLAQFVEFMWYYDGWEGTHSMERVLPDGSFELVINLRDDARKLFDRDDWSRAISFRNGWLSGTHSRFIVIDTVPGASMIGAHFRPGGVRAFLEPPAAEFQDQVIEFEAVWGHYARELREQLLAAPGSTAKFQYLEHFLLERLRHSPTDSRREERITWATNQLCWQPQMATISTVAGRLGISHKHLIDQFRQQVGLTPKLFCRIRRFQQALAEMHSRRQIRWVDVACACGYYDQAHFINDFHRFAGIRPSLYTSLDEQDANFVPIGETE